jgi:hypothetical protein
MKRCGGYIRGMLDSKSAMFVRKNGSLGSNYLSLHCFLYATLLGMGNDVDVMDVLKINA